MTTEENHVDINDHIPSSLEETETEAAVEDEDNHILLIRRGRHGSAILESATSSSMTSSSLPVSTQLASMTLGHFVGSVANLCSATLGAGILALPFAIEQAGVICGACLLVASAWATSYSIQLLVKACDHYHLSTYESIVQRALGQTWRQIVEVSILIFCGGTAVAYVIAVGDILERAEQQLPDSTGGERKRLKMIVVWFVSMLPLSCLRRMQSLQCASSVGIASILTLLLASAVHLIAPQDPGEDWVSPSFKDLKPFLLPASSRNSCLAVLRACPIVFFAFSCQVNVCQIYDELPSSSAPSLNVNDTMSIGGNNDEEEENNRNDNRNKVRSMKWVTWTAVGICGFLYSSISLVTLMDFGHAIRPNILSCYKLTSQETLLHVAFVAMALAVVMAFPLNIFPARVSVVQMMMNYSKNKNQAGSNSTVLAEEQFSYKPEAEQPLLGNNTKQDNNKNNSGYSSNGNDDLEQRCIGGGDPLQSPHLSSSVDDDDVNIGNRHGDDDENFNFCRHAFLTLLLAGSALGLALVVPNISVVFGLLGGTTSSLLGFVVPGLIGLQMSESSRPNNVNANDSSIFNNLGCWILVIAGTLIGILTTGVTIYSTFL